MLATDIGNLLVPIEPAITIDKVCAPPLDGIASDEVPTTADVLQFIVLLPIRVAVVVNTIVEFTFTD